MKIKDCIEKTYCLYASDWHLTIMLLPFISKKLCEKDRIYMKFENSIEDKIKQLTNRLRISNKDEINDISWNMEISDEDFCTNERIYIIAGSGEYMDDMNNKISQYYKNKDCKVSIINCFDVCAGAENSDLLTNRAYNKILTTKGESIISSQ
ncbi:MAG: hypothetical protein IKE91_00115 [Clostridia bacterium]|nr:hypothetical protein [Clostridia bacterium]